MRRLAVTVLIVTLGVLAGQPPVRLGARAAAGQENNGRGTLLAEAPMFLLPDATRTPLATLPAGTTVRLLAREGDWYKVIYHDAFLGDRTGYIQTRNIRVETDGSPPVPAAGTRGAAGRATPQRTAPRPPARAVAPRKPSSWSDRGYLSLNGTYQATSNAFTGVTTLTQFVEAGNLTTTYDVAHPPVLDVSGMARVWRNLAVGVAVTWLSQTLNGTVSANIPHPFLFNAPRTVTGVVVGLPRRELAVHMNAAWVVPAGRKAQLAIFGGPSYFQVTQGLVIDVSASSTYPYDAATFVSGTTLESSQSQLGFNGGLDITARVSKHVGVGAIVRYSHASLQFPAPLGPGVTVRAGGLQVGGGIRFAF